MLAWSGRAQRQRRYNDMISTSNMDKSQPYSPGL
jgi:hypothetical protein